MRVFRGEQSLSREELLLTGLLVAGAAMLLVTLVSAAGSDRLGYDFRTTYLPAAHAVRHGDSPLTSPTSPLIAEGKAYAYPPLLAILVVPFTAVSVNAAAFVAFVLSLAALVGTLAVLGVRDLRCYAALLLWAPGFNALETANVSAGLALLAALAWRYRESAWSSAACVASAVALKLFLWPLIVWQAATRRVHSAALAVVLLAALIVVSWAVIGFAGLTAFPDLVQANGDRESYSLAAIAAFLGYGWTAGHILAALIGGSLVVACVWLGRNGDDMRAFVCAIGASLALTPMLWQHYLVLLAVPLALGRPRFSALWLLPIVLWMSPRSGIPDGAELFLPALVSVVVMSAVVLARPVRIRAERAVP